MNKNNYIIDTHCHLDFDPLYNQIDEVIARASDAEVKKLISICVEIKKFENILHIAEKFENVYCSIGTHPNSADKEKDITIEDIINKTKHPKVVAIGETGLDYFYENSSRDIQKINFIKHIKAAQNTSLPLVIHTRNADKDTSDILVSEIKKTPFKFIMHCYSSGIDLANTAIDLGGYISFSGIVTFKNAEEVRIIAKKIPLERILIETDAPYLAPVPYRGKSNEPSYILKTAEMLSDILCINYNDFIEQTTANALKVFDKIR